MHTLLLHALYGDFSGMMGLFLLGTLSVRCVAHIHCVRRTYSVYMCIYAGSVYIYRTHTAQCV